MKAAIYARKSTDQSGTAEEAKSVTRQVESGRIFAASKAWEVGKQHAFVDDGISGAEFEKRPGLQGMLAAAQRGEFTRLIVSEQKSIGREAFETNYLVKQLAEAGVEVWGYLDGRCLTPRNAMDKAMSSLRAFGDEAHREDTSKRGHESHSLKHRRGQVVGGRVFGYRNVDILAGEDAHGRPLRSHVERVVEEEEAVVVRWIFELYASGLGLKGIAKHLTREGALAPKPFVRKEAFGLPSVKGWAPSTIRSVLSREDYRGVYVWNRSRKRDDWGKVNQRPRPESEWQRTPMPQWRIVSDDLWHRVASRRQDVEGRALRFGSGRLSGRPPKHALHNLLAGLATCGVCGGGLVVETTKHTKVTARRSHYVCNRRRMNGGCANTLRLSVEVVNEAVLEAIEEHALTPEAVELVIALSERSDRQEHEDRLGRERKDVEKRIGHLVAAIEHGADVSSLVAKLRTLEGRRADIASEITNLRPIPRLDPAVVEDRLGEWRRLLRASTTQGRSVLQRLLAGRIVFTPLTSPVVDRNGYSFEAPTRFDRLFSGVAAPAPAWMPEGDPLGTDEIRPEDTLERDYGRLLRQAYDSNRKGVASPPGFGLDYQPIFKGILRSDRRAA